MRITSGKRNRGSGSVTIASPDAPRPAVNVEIVLKSVCADYEVLGWSSSDGDSGTVQTSSDGVHTFSVKGGKFRYWRGSGVLEIGDRYLYEPEGAPCACSESATCNEHRRARQGFV